MNAVTQRKYKLMDEPLTLRTYSGYSINSPQGFCKVNFWNDVKQLDGYDLDECLWKCIVLAGDGSKTLPCKCNAPSGKAWKVISIKSLHIDLCSNRQWRVTFVAVDIPVELAERGCKAEIERLTKLVDQKDSEIHKLMEDCVCHERSLRISKNALAAAIGRGDRFERERGEAIKTIAEDKNNIAWLTKNRDDAYRRANGYACKADTYSNELKSIKTELQRFPLPMEVSQIRRSPEPSAFRLNVEPYSIVFPDRHSADRWVDAHRGIVHESDEEIESHKKDSAIIHNLIHAVKTLKAENAVLRNDLEQKGDLNVASLRDAVREWRKEAHRLQGENRHLTESVQVLKERKEKLRAERNEWRNFCKDIHKRGLWIVHRYLRLEGDETINDLLDSFLDGMITLKQRWPEDNSNE